MTSMATETRETRAWTLREVLEDQSAREAVTPYLPEGITYDRVMRDVFAAADDNPKIRKCEPRSIIRAVARAVSWDLTIGDTAFLVPRYDDRAKVTKLTAMQGYRGKIVILKRHRLVKHVNARCVYEGEHFQYQEGSNAFIEHRPVWQPTGKMLGVYAWAQITHMTGQACVMSAQEVEAIRREFSQQWSPSKAGALEGIPWYAIARCVHRLTKLLGLDANLARMLTDDFDDAEEARERVAGTAVVRRDRRPEPWTDMAPTESPVAVVAPKQLSAPMPDLTRVQRTPVAVPVAVSALDVMQAAQLDHVPHPNEIADDMEPSDADDAQLGTHTPPF